MTLECWLVEGGEHGRENKIKEVLRIMYFRFRHALLEKSYRYLYTYQYLYIGS